MPETSLTEEDEKKLLAELEQQIDEIQDVVVDAVRNVLDNTELSENADHGDALNFLMDKLKEML